MIFSLFKGEFMFIGGGNSGYIPRDSHGLIRKSGFPNARYKISPLKFF